MLKWPYTSAFVFHLTSQNGEDFNGMQNRYVFDWRLKIKKETQTRKHHLGLCKSFFLLCKTAELRYCQWLDSGKNWDKRLEVMSFSIKADGSYTDKPDTTWLNKDLQDTDTLPSTHCTKINTKETF